MESGGLQQHPVQKSGEINNAGDKHISDGNQVFSYTGPRLQRTDAQSIVADVGLLSQGSINSNNIRIIMATVDLRNHGRQIFCMYRRFQCPIDKVVSMRMLLQLISD